jgi:two-component system, chemotaxis family, protein-glutamate methylesterase/glutaminase
MANANLNNKKKKEIGDDTISGSQRIIVIGASSGGFEALKKLVHGLPPDFNASIFIVWHMSPDVPGILPQVLNRVNKIYAAHAYDGEEIKPNRIYISRPDHHLLIRNRKVRITHGPKENRFRPAIDPLFRSAAYAYTHRVIGVILSGALDDGTAGLWTVKHHGGIAIVQDPSDAEVPAMPESAKRQVNVDHCVPVSEIAELLVRLCKEPITEKRDVMKDEQTRKEIEIAAEENAVEKSVMDFGELSPFTCPECHGVLSGLYDGDLVRYRCHTGHAYTVAALMASLTEKVEDYLYNATRGMDETIILLNHLGDHYAEANQPQLAALFFKKAKQAADRSQFVRQAVMPHEQLSKESLEKEVQNESVGAGK